jgi:hypothetical protein
MNPRDFKPFPAFVNQRRWRVGDYARERRMMRAMAARIMAAPVSGRSS